MSQGTGQGYQGYYGQGYYIVAISENRRLEALSHHRYARNRRAVAPDWFSCVLATNFQSQEAGWKKTDSEGGSGTDHPDGRSEPQLGSAADPWGTPHARFRAFRENHLKASDKLMDRAAAARSISIWIRSEVRHL